MADNGVSSALTDDTYLALPLPDGWAQLDLDAATVERFNAFMASMSPVLASAGLDTTSISGLLREVAGDARLHDVRLAAVWFHNDERGTLVQASVTVMAVPAEVRPTLVDDPSWDYGTLPHPDGDTLIRRVRLKALDQPFPPMSGPLEPLGQALSNRQGLAEYFRTVPGTDDLCLISFSSVTVDVWHHLLTLFDQIVLRSRWELGPEAAHSEPA